MGGGFKFGKASFFLACLLTGASIYQCGQENKADMDVDTVPENNVTKHKQEIILKKGSSPLKRISAGSSLSGFHRNGE